MTNLERAYGRLLRLYPAEYRRTRGAEMLDVLLASAEPWRRRPPWREGSALLVGALRVRAGAAGHRSASQSWRTALRNAAAVLLLPVLADAVEGQFYENSHLINGVLIALMAATVVLIMRDQFLLSAATAVGALLLVSVPVWRYDTLDYAPHLVTVLGLLIPLVGRGPVVAPRSLRMLIPLMLVPTLFPNFVNLWSVSSEAFAIASMVIQYALPAIAIVWSIVDERLTLAYGLIQLPSLVYPVLHWQNSVAWLDGVNDPTGLIAPLTALLVIPTLCVVLSTQLARRRARI